MERRPIGYYDLAVSSNSIKPYIAAQKSGDVFMYNSQNIVNRIKEYAKSKNIYTSKMLDDCGLSKNTLSSMQSRGSFPQVDTLAKIADYLNCSIDYLLDRTEKIEVNK